MTETTRKILTIMAVSEDNGETWYPDYVEQDELDSTEYSFSVTNHITDAMDLSEFAKEDHLNIFEAFAKAYDGDFVDCKFINASMTTIIEDVEVTDEYAEILQKRALAKLTPTEMKALDVMKLFTYIKLKFHKTA